MQRMVRRATDLASSVYHTPGGVVEGPLTGREEFGDLAGAVERGLFALAMS